MSSRIVGGHAARAGQFPSTVSLHTADLQRFICAGSIISSRFVLTAAHCMDQRWPENVRLRAGTNALHSGGSVHAVARIQVHELFEPRTRRHDLATVQIVGAFRFDQRLVAPIALRTWAVTQAVAETAGWGWTWPGNGHINEALQTLQTNVLTNQQCTQRHELPIPIDQRHMCTLAGAGRGVCNGDSGGPLIVGGQLVGVVSRAVPCATGVPDVYVRVSEYVRWIAEHTQ